MKRLNIKRIYSNDADFGAIGGVERMFAKLGFRGIGVMVQTLAYGAMANRAFRC